MPVLCGECEVLKLTGPLVNVALRKRSTTSLSKLSYDRRGGELGDPLLRFQISLMSP